MNNCSFEVLDTIDTDVRDTLKNGLMAHASALENPLPQEQAVSIVRRDNNGKVVAGLTGNTFWNWLHVGTLWVDDALRGQGIGSALMQVAEEEAKKRGCVGAFVWTESFQGKGFYPKLGYKEFVVMDDFPIGHQRIGFMKSLVEANK